MDRVHGKAVAGVDPYTQVDYRGDGRLRIVHT